MKLIKRVLLGCSIATGTIWMAAAAQAEEVTLKGVSCFPIGSPVGVPFEEVVNTINERGEGVVQIDLKGGAPAIGDPFTVVQKVSRGIYDITGCPGAFFVNVFPEAPVLDYIQIPYSELRSNGGFELLSELMLEKDVRFLGRYHDFGPFHLWLNEKIDKPDLSGLHLRVSPVYTPFFKAMGATTQASNISQVYTYMENNTVQGFGWPALGWLPSWAEVTKYRVEPGFYTAALFTLMAERTWASLDEEQRELIETVVKEFEARSEPNSSEQQALLQKQKEWTASQGLEAITFEGEDAETWSNSAIEAGWNQLKSDTPEHADRIRELISR